MPVKRRQSKRRPEENRDAWMDFFDCGHDFFDELPMSEAEARIAAADAWRRFGRDFMATWQPKPNRAKPWALELFGEP